MDNIVVKVALGERSYNIHIGSGLLAQAGASIAPLLRDKRVIIVVDENVAAHYLVPLQASLKEVGIRSDAVKLPAGEQTKSFTGLADLADEILELLPDRDTALIALGGGVVGDITGFAASIILRGIPFIQIPTTLLAQVDSSVGGKTGINTEQGKNLVGSFYQPRLVLADVKTLSTLPKRELLAGYAETVKYGLIADKPFFEWLEKYGAQLLGGDIRLLAHAVAHSCQAKAAIVAADEREQGRRALLNFGHTFGHALEAETGYSDELLHGEAVAIGMIMAMEFSYRLGLCPKEDLDRVKAHFISVGLPASPADIRAKWSAKKLLAHMAHDKKAKAGALTFILSRGIGESFVSRDVTSEETLTFLENFLNNKR